MKTLLLVTIISVSLLTFASAQNPELKSFEITYGKTTSLVFPFSIQSVDRGSRDILAQKAKGVDNVLQLKASRRQFPESNVTIITADGLLHEFRVCYSENPSGMTYFVNAPRENDRQLVKFSSGANMKELTDVSAMILRWKPVNQNIHERQNKLRLTLQGIYLQGNTLFYRLNIYNRSNLSYNIQSLRFFIRDKRQMKRSASQEIEIQPLLVYNRPVQVKGKSGISLVYSFPLFTIPDAKKLSIELMEKNGGRNLEIVVSNRSIVKAIPVK